ncbi:hypothetical protein G6F22_013891 [Rhizopus arrhizus]|nr:hypothetical protein G6F22_013891 [Rhizopus arrhizus]
MRRARASGIGAPGNHHVAVFTAQALADHLHRFLEAEIDLLDARTAVELGNDVAEQAGQARDADRPDHRTAGVGVGMAQGRAGQLGTVFAPTPAFFNLDCRMTASTPFSAGARFREALAAESPLQVIGAINANHALLAKRAGFRAIYLSGGGVAAGSLGLPDLGINTLEDVLVDVRRITDVCDLPLMVDIDTGFGPSAFNIARTVKSLIKAGAAACHIEDQVGAKRCGHRPGKEIVSQGEMVDRVKAAADAKTDPDFFLIARTDAIQVDGVDKAIERAIACVEAGADGIFAEAAYDLDTYRRFVDAVKVPPR